MDNQQYGHTPTRYSKKFMKELLADTEKYLNDGDSFEVVMSMLEEHESEGIDKIEYWQGSRYTNIETDNTFFGEPEVFNKYHTKQTYVVNTEDTKLGEYIENKSVEWWFSYHFKGRRYKNKGIMNPKWLSGYGSNIYVDRLYYILVNRFNNGVDFVHEFLDIVVPHIMRTEILNIVRPIVREITQAVGESLVRITNSGELDKRFNFTKSVEAKLNKKFSSISWEKRKKRLEDKIKDLFINSMTLGTIGGHSFINHVNSESTKKTKEKIFGSEMSEFVGSKQFIKSIVIDLHVRVKQ